METYVCPTTKDPTKREAPRAVSSVFMENNWTYHAYSMAHDGKTTIVHQPDGIEVLRQGRPKLMLTMNLPFNPRDFYWHPDSKRVAFWVVHTPKPQRPGQLVTPRRSLAIMDVNKLGNSPPKAGDPPPYDIVYVTPPDQTPFGLEWSPKGDAVYLIQRGVDPVDNQAFGTIVRIKLTNTDDPTEIVRMPGGLDFFMPPVSRYERGEGPSSSDYLIIFGHMDGLYTIEPDGKNPRRLSQLPAVGLYNIEWNPKPNKKEVILFFRRAVPGADGRTFVGAYLVRLDQLLRQKPAEAGVEASAPAAGGGGPEAIEQLYDGTDVHTLWYSPRGTYMTWATPWGLWYRRPDDPAEKAVQVQIPPQAEGVQLEIKGVTWHDNEQKLAFTAGNKLFICELPANEVYEVASFGKDTHTFLAEPRFVGDEVFLSSFEDANASGRIQKGFQFGTPDNPVDPSLGRGRVPTDVSTQEQPEAPAGQPGAGQAPAGGTNQPARGGGRQPAGGGGQRGNR